MIIFLIYIAIFVGSFFLVRLIVDQTAKGYSARKTVTFGDESAVTSNRSASVVSILTIFLLVSRIRHRFIKETENAAARSDKGRPLNDD